MKDYDQKTRLLTGLGIMAAASAVVIACSGPAYDSLSKIGRVQRTEKIYTPGTYEAEAQGFGGPVKVTVTVDEANITVLEISGENETPDLGRKAISSLKADILKNQTLELDSISGATITSEAVKEATGKALARARGEEVVEETAPAAADAGEGTFAPGTYSAEVRGMKAMTVTATFNENKITDIQVEHEETEGIGAPVVENFRKH